MPKQFEPMLSKSLPYRELKTQTAARKELGLDEMREIGKYADFFALMCETHPELVREYYMSTFAKVRCEQAELPKTDENYRKGMSFAAQMQWYKENAEMLADRITGEARKPVQKKG
jgi:hypothetical protein